MCVCVYIFIYTDSYVVDLASSERFGLVIICHRIAGRHRKESASTAVSSVHVTSVLGLRVALN